MEPYYKDDWVTIYNGDCREILTELPRVDMIFADPPYGVGFKYAGIYQDDDIKSYFNLIGDFLNIAQDKSEVLFMTVGMRHIWLYPPATWILCWAKPGSTRASKLGGFSEWEPILVYGKRRIYNDFKMLPDCVNHSKTSGNHPCPKPENLLKWLIDIGSDENNTILDPFLGSGTTLLAAKQYGRKAIGIEIEEKYCEIAAKRLSQEVLNFTG